MKGNINSQIDLDYFKEHLNNLKLHTKDGKRINYRYEVTRLRNKRTPSQNAYLWLLNNIIADHTGYSQNEIHDKYLQHLRTFKFEDLTGKIKDYVKGTSDMNTKELTDYIEKVKDYSAMEIDLRLPSADIVPLDMYDRFHIKVN